MVEGGWFYLDRVDLILPNTTELNDSGGDSNGHSGDGHHPSSSSSDTSAIVGGIIGSLALIALVIMGIVALKYYRKKQDRSIRIPDTIPIYCETFSFSNGGLLNRFRRFYTLSTSAKL